MLEQDKKLKNDLKSDYPLVPMKDISDEARLISVAWMDCDDKRWIGNKHKLASDIMNYSRRRIEQLAEKLREANPYTDNKTFERINLLRSQTWEECVDKLIELLKQKS